MKAIPLLVGACLFTSGALVQSVPEMQKMADEWQAAFNNGDAATVANFYKDDAVVFPPGEQNTVDIIERYQNSNAAVQHVTQTFAKYAKEFLENAQVGRFVVYGSSNDEVKKVLKDFNPVYFSAFDGFTR
jgi:hypothetical protein